METNAQAPDTPEKAEKKEKKWLKPVILAVVGIIVVLVLLFFGYKIFGPKPEITHLSLSDSTVEYNGEVTITVECENPGLFSASKDIAVYVDDEIAFEDIFELKSKEVLSEEYTLESLTDGNYTVSVEDESEDFTVLTEASFSTAFTSVPECFISGVPGEIGYSVSNAGKSSGVASVDLKLNGEVIETREYTLGGLEFAEDTFSFSAPEGSSLTISINDEEFTADVYTATTLKNATRLMTNTVKGYGYFDFTNLTDKDIIVYFTDYNDFSVAVNVTVVKSGDYAKISSFPHGSYAMFIQTGDYWIEELQCFAQNQVIGRYNDALTFENNVSKAYGGTYTYWTINFSGSMEGSPYYTILDSPPALAN